MKNKAPILLFIASAILVVGGLIVWRDFIPPRGNVDEQQKAVDRVRGELQSTDHCYIDWEKMELWARIDLRGERVVTCSVDIVNQTVQETVSYIDKVWKEMVKP